MHPCGTVLRYLKVHEYTQITPPGGVIWVYLHSLIPGGTFQSNGLSGTFGTTQGFYYYDAFTCVAKKSSLRAVSANSKTGNFLYKNFKKKTRI